MTTDLVSYSGRGHELALSGGEINSLADGVPLQKIAETVEGEFRILSASEGNRGDSPSGPKSQTTESSKRLEPEIPYMIHRIIGRETTQAHGSGKPMGTGGILPYLVERTNDAGAFARGDDLYTRSSVSINPDLIKREIENIIEEGCYTPASRNLAAIASNMKWRDWEIKPVGEKSLPLSEIRLDLGERFDRRRTL